MVKVCYREQSTIIRANCQHIENETAADKGEVGVGEEAADKMLRAGGVIKMECLILFSAPSTFYFVRRCCVKKVDS